MGSYKKKLFIALLLILLIGFFVCGSVNASTTHYQEESTYTINSQEYLESNQELLARIFIKYYFSNATEYNKTNFLSYLNNGDYWPLFSYSRSSSTGNYYISCYFLPYKIDFGGHSADTIYTQDAYFEDYYFLVPVSGYQLNAQDMGVSYYKQFVSFINSTNTSNLNKTDTLFIPTLLIYYNNNTISNYKNGIEPTDNIYLMIMQSIQENTEQQEETTNEMKKLNDFMKSEDVDQDAYDMPGYSDNPTQDITQAGVDNIFNIFYDAIDNWNSRDILVTIPFANKIFWIDADLTENIVDNFFPSGIFKNLLGLVWYYLLAVYVIKDVQKYIDGLQTGEILTKSDTNIKTEML